MFDQRISDVDQQRQRLIVASVDDQLTIHNNGDTFKCDLPTKY